MKKSTWISMVVVIIILVVVTIRDHSKTAAEMKEETQRVQETTEEIESEVSETHAPETKVEETQAMETEFQMELASDGKPMLKVSGSGAFVGYAVYMAENIDNLVSGNPWRENWSDTSLPVFKNTLMNFDTEDDKEKIAKNRQTFLMDVAKRWGVDVPETLPPHQYELTGDGVTIEVDPNYRVIISLDPAIVLPEEYSYDCKGTYEEIYAVAEYLKEKYNEFLSMPMGQIAVSDWGVNIYGEHSYNISFYQASDAIWSLLNYNFQPVSFTFDEGQDLYRIVVGHQDFSETLGSYPIITVNEAKELMANGNFFTTVSSEFPGMDYVAKVELIYRSGFHEEYLMPYYMFYVELPEEARDGLKGYALYYVPAVESQYISNMPIWDGTPW